jgi:prepilin-type N-terminal cleavage/methylation domain-containing protein
MGMKKLKVKVRERRRQAAGFTLLEMMIVVAIGITASLIAVMGMVPVLNQQHVNNAYNTTLAAMRQARDNAVSQRTSYSVTFSRIATPNTIVVAPTISGFTGDQSNATYQLPIDVTFGVQSAMASATAPDGYGSGTAPIDFGYPAPGNTGGGQLVVYFCPDGSSQNSGGAGNCSGMNNWSGGVVYLTRGTDTLGSRAITLWGGTGRIRGWRLYSTGSTYQWVRQ